MTKAKQERAVYEKFMQAYNIELVITLLLSTFRDFETSCFNFCI
jgi:hypothetical protein